MLCLPQNSCITGTSLSDYLVSYLGHSLGRLTLLQRCSWCILQPHLTEQCVYMCYLVFTLSICVWEIIICILNVFSISYQYKCVCVCVFIIYMWVCVYIYICVYTHTHTHTPAYIYLYWHIIVYSPMSWWAL